MSIENQVAAWYVFSLLVFAFLSAIYFGYNQEASEKYLFTSRYTSDIVINFISVAMFIAMWPFAIVVGVLYVVVFIPLKFTYNSAKKLNKNN